MPGSRRSSASSAVSGDRTFAREAMAARFTIRLVHDDVVYAHQAAAAAFEELELLEQLLSQFVEGSDIWRINRMAVGQQTVVALETYECLEIARQCQYETAGAFNIAFASPPDSRNEAFLLREDERSVEVRASGVVIDLGGIGKGFALDRMADVLRQWDVGSALLWASSSTVLALGCPEGQQGWPVLFRDAEGGRELALRDSAASASGTAVKGPHILDPRTGHSASRSRIWATAPTASQADAFSTAFLVMSDEEIGNCCRSNPRVAAYFPSVWE